MFENGVILYVLIKLGRKYEKEKKKKKFCKRYGKSLKIFHISIKAGNTKNYEDKLLKEKRRDKMPSFLS